jgi:hypothetical protein
MFFTSLVAKRSGAECDPGARPCCRQPFRTQCPNALFTCRPSRATRTRARLHKDGEVPVYKKQRANGLGAQPRCRPLPAVLGQSTRNNDAKPASDERRKKDAPACFLRRSWRSDLARSVTPGCGDAVGNISHPMPNALFTCRRSRATRTQAGLHKDPDVPRTRNNARQRTWSQPMCRPLRSVLAQATRNNDAKPAPDERRKKDAPACFLRRSWRSDLARSVTPSAKPRAPSPNLTSRIRARLEKCFGCNRLINRGQVFCWVA